MDSPVEHTPSAPLAASPRAYTVRNWIYDFDLNLLEFKPVDPPRVYRGKGTPKKIAARLADYWGKRPNKSTCKAVLLSLLQEMEFKEYTTASRIDDIAARAEVSRRTAQRKLFCLEHAGLIRRTPTGPGPWKYTLDVARCAELAPLGKERRRAGAKERAERLRAQRHEEAQRATARHRARIGLVDAEPSVDTMSSSVVVPAPSAAAPPPTAPQVTYRRIEVQPSTRPERRRSWRERCERPPVAPELAHALWNLAPWHESGSRDVHNLDTWKPEILRRDRPAELWSKINTFLKAARGNADRFGVAATLRFFMSPGVQDELHQVLLRPSLGEPYLGRRPFERRGDKAPEPEPPPAWWSVEARVAYLAPWLRPYIAEIVKPGDHDHLVLMVSDVLNPERGPPDWLHSDHHPLWGELPLFDDLD